MATDQPEDFAEQMNAMHADGWAHAMGLKITRATRDGVTAELVVGPQHRQPYGIVHGGVHAGIVETIASIGAAIDALAHGRSVVGLENSTSFLRAVREGKLIATARPLTRGQRSQVWEGEVRDEQGRLVATGRVRLLVLEQGTSVAGEQVGVKSSV